jgi:hypothetical protein
MRKQFIPLFFFLVVASFMPWMAESKPSRCLIAYRLDWTGMKGSNLGEGFLFHPFKGDPTWTGTTIPDWANDTMPGVGTERDSRGLPTTINFGLSGKNCIDDSHKEKVAEIYFQFWQAQGVAVPDSHHRHRIPDSEIVTHNPDYKTQ